MKIQRTLRSDLISGTSRGDFMRKREAYINDLLRELNSHGISILRIDDERTVRGPLGNVYGHVNILWEADTDDPVFQKYMNETSASNNTSSSGGCYIATNVYGSYNCPQVWVLRRYRDDHLAPTWYGRAIIAVYYFISPSLVRWFGNTKWFRKFWRTALDHLISRLKISGIKDTPYEDNN